MSNIIDRNYNNFDASSEGDLGYGQLLATLWHRRYWFAGVFTGVLAIFIPLAIFKQPVYESHMQILVEPNYQKATGGNSGEYLEREFADNTIQVDYATQLKVFKSAKILNRVAEKLITNQAADEIITTDSDELSYEDKIYSLASYLKGSLNVFQVLGDDEETLTKIIQANYIGSDRVETKRVLEVIQEVYVEYNLEQQEKRLRDGLNFVNNQIPKAQQELLKAEAAVTQLSKAYNLISPEDDAYAVKENIRQLSQQRSELKAQKSEVQGNLAALQEQLGLPEDNSVALSRLSQSPRYQNLLNELQETEILLATQQQKFTNDNPIIQSLIDERDSKKALLKDEAEKILGEVPPNFLSDLESLSKKGQLVESDTNFIARITESQSNLAGIRERERSLAQAEADLEQELTEFPELISRYKNLTQQVEIQRNSIQRLLQAKQELEVELNRGSFNWQVVEPPQPGEQIAPNLQQDLLLSLVVASFLGLTAAFIRETIDKRISNTEEITSKTDLRLLGTTPKLSASKGILSKLPLFNSQITSTREVVEWQPFREAIDMIYENLRLSSGYSSLKSLAVTSAIAGEGKSTFTLGLALTVARHQHRVLVIDADLRRPSLHQSFNLNNDLGLSDYLASDIKQPMIHQVSFSGETIELITSGTQIADPVRLLSTQKFNYWIEQQKQNYDLIIVDTPPVLGMVDAVKVASACDNTVLVTRLNKAKVSELLETTAVLSNLKVLGIVANDSIKITQHYRQSQYLSPTQTQLN